MSKLGKAFIAGTLILAASIGHHLRQIPGRSGWGPDRAQERALPVAGRQEGHRLAGRAGAGQAALSDAAVESTTMSGAARAFTTGLVAMSLWIGVAAIGNAQPPIRIGASLGQTGAYANPAENSVAAISSASSTRTRRPGSWDAGSS
jgi:hypothetical protein